jgi:protoporphyrinogen oxidase
MTDVLVVGAGMAGLAAALEAMRAGASVLVLEAASRPGGMVHTERIDGEWIVEAGPDSFLTARGGVTAVAADLGIEHRVTPLATTGSGLWTGTTLRPLSEGEAAALLGIQAKTEDLSTPHASFAGGMGDLMEAIAARLGSSLRVCQDVGAITIGKKRISIHTRTGMTESARGAVLAQPAWRAAELLGSVSPETGDALAGIPYLPSLTVSLAYRADRIGTAIGGTGFVVQADTAAPLRACTYASLKFPHRAPPGHVLLRAFLNPTSERPEVAAHRRLSEILRIEGQPLWSRVYHWARGIPFYSKDHAERVGQARAAMWGRGAVALAGAGYDGAGVTACLESGRRAAREVLEATR